MSSWLEPKTAPAWILSTGMALVSLGLMAQSQDDPPTTPPQQFLQTQGGFGTADSNSSMIAVTGVDVTGSSILFLVDTQGRHLSVYSAQSGTSSTSSVKWVGARNIDLDLRVDGFNDKSELKYKELAQRFAESGASAAADKH